MSNYNKENYFCSNRDGIMDILTIDSQKQFQEDNRKKKEKSIHF